YPQEAQFCRLADESLDTRLYQEVFVGICPFASRLRVCQPRDSLWRSMICENLWAIFKNNSARSTSIFSIICSEAELGRECGCSTRAAVPAATWSTFSRRGTTCSAWTRTRTRLSTRAASLHPTRRLYLRAIFGWRQSKKWPSQTLSPTWCS